MKVIDAFARGRKSNAFSQRLWNICTQPLQASRAESSSAPAFLMSAGFMLKLVLLAAVFLFSALPAFAADITVGASCTLAQAITAANTNTAGSGDCAAGDAGADTIILTDNVDLSADLPDITESLIINGEGYIISGEDTHRCFDVIQADIPPAGLSLTLNRVIIEDCTTAAAGGAIRFWNQLDVDNTQGRSELTLNDVVLRDSEATGLGGGIYTRADNVNRPIYVEINRSAIHGNTSDQNGGGIYFAAGTQATVNNSTIYMNTAANRGGGIFGQAATPAEANFTLNHVTITANTASTTSSNKAGGVRFVGGTLTIRNSIIAGNSNDGTNEDCQLESATAMITVTVTTSIIGSGATANCKTINAAGMPVAVTADGAITDPGLEANPTDSGGIPPYYALTATSPAINAAPDCFGQTLDQRGEARPFPAGGRCDIGAYEFTGPVELLLGPIIYVPRDCTLPDAINAVNANAAVDHRCWVGEAGADTIILTDNVDLDANLPEITNSLTIYGRNRVISGQDMYRCIIVDTRHDTPTAGIALSLNDLTISNCRSGAREGGAIYFRLFNSADPASSLSLERVTVRHSQTHTANSIGGGGGLHAESVGGLVTVTINRSSFHNNATTQHGAGGGIALVRDIKATITNTSIFDNVAEQKGGGIFWDGRNAASGNSLTLNHVTITGNNAKSQYDHRGGGLYFFHRTLVMHNSIITGNMSAGNEDGSNCRVRSNSLTFTDRSNNIAGTGSTNCPTISVGGTPVTDAKLAANPTDRAHTRYYDLMAGSPAINAAGNCRSITRVDQRGYIRPWPVGGRCDIGAIEYGSQLTPPPPTPTPTKAPVPAPIPTPRPCPSAPEGGRYGSIGSGQWQGHYARLGIQAQANQAAWARGDAGVRGANTCFWDYDCSTNAHWAYGSYHATRGHVILAPGSPPPLAVGRGGGKYNLCYSVWENGCNSTEAWEFGFASGKQIYDEWFYQREIAARSEC